MRVDNVSSSGFVFGTTRKQPYAPSAVQRRRVNAAIEELLEHPLACAAFFAKDGTFIVEYPKGFFPTALGIKYIRGEPLEMIRRAAIFLDKKHERMQLC